MPKIPTPAALVERAISAGRFVEDREWKQYQRYLAETQKAVRSYIQRSNA